MAQISTPVKLATVKRLTMVATFHSGFDSERVVDLHGTVNWLQCPKVRTPSYIGDLQFELTQRQETRALCPDASEFFSKHVNLSSYWARLRPSLQRGLHFGRSYDSYPNVNFTFGHGSAAPLDRYELAGVPVKGLNPADCNTH